MMLYCFITAIALVSVLAGFLLALVVLGGDRVIDCRLRSSDFGLPDVFLDRNCLVLCVLLDIALYIIACMV